MRASVLPPSAASMLFRWPSSPTPASTSAGTRPGKRYVLLPVGPVQGEALLAWRRTIGLSELILVGREMARPASRSPRDYVNGFTIVQEQALIRAVETSRNSA